MTTPTTESEKRDAKLAQKLVLSFCENRLKQGTQTLAKTLENVVSYHLSAEREARRVEVAELKHQIDESDEEHYIAVMEKQDKEIQQLRSENTRLREALMDSNQRCINGWR